MTVGQRQRLYSGVRMFIGNYLSSTPRALREGGDDLELTPLMRGRIRPKSALPHIPLLRSCRQGAIRGRSAFWM